MVTHVAFINNFVKKQIIEFYFDSKWQSRAKLNKNLLRFAQSAILP